VSRTYLEVLAEMPWGITVKGNVSLEKARQQLDQDHYGLADVKKYIYQYIAVHALSKRDKNNLTTTNHSADENSSPSTVNSTATALESSITESSDAVATSSGTGELLNGTLVGGRDNNGTFT
jgi:ATP-dependent Lon protease